MAQQNPDSSREDDLVVPHDAPTTFGGILKQVGPGLIVTASIVGSGELIVTTKLGADVGFVLLWFIIFGCIIKVFVQVELGRYAISHGQTTLQALNQVPGPRKIVNWVVWAWLLMYLGTFIQLAGIVGVIGGVLQLGGLNLSSTACAALITISCAALLVMGRYRLIETVSTTMVALFTLFTICAVGALYWTDLAVTSADLAEGFRFRLTDDFTVAFAAFGIIGVGASELIYYPYWCLEKGYGKSVGPNDGSAAWVERARGWMRVLLADAWLSMVVYTGATVAFYILGAAVLHGKGIEVTEEDLVPSLSEMYTESFGPIGLWTFIVGAFVVLYSTVFIATASNGRLLADALGLFRLVQSKDQKQHDRLIRISCVVLPMIYFVLFWSFSDPLALVIIGALGQAVMLPLLCIAALWFHHTGSEPALRSNLIWTVCLWGASLAMVIAGGYQLIEVLKKYGSMILKVILEGGGV
ncbi:MAG: hypothetical protein GY768_06395 [Planctomycetaceae bacterium]|nr:hypothetical protein [Planctomycetaceae bacterium]